MRTLEADAARQIVAQKFQTLAPFLDERQRRLWAATEARALGYGGVAVVNAATGLARPTIETGLTELDQPEPLAPGQVRAPGGGRKPLTLTDPTLSAALEALVEPVSRGDPQSPLRWVSKSLRHLAQALTQKGHRISHSKVGDLLREAGYSLQANRKTLEGAAHPDRDSQFEYINAQAKHWQASGQPVISVDCKKKELVGSFRNGGREWHPQGQPDEVRVHDFVDKEGGKAIPYGVYDVAKNQGFVSVGCDHDTAEFAAATIERWWQKMGQTRYPAATDLMIACDGGGSNGSRCRLWKVALQGFAQRSGLRLHICHLPPGTSKWNKIEHRLFSHITLNWRGRPLVSLEVIVALIANTTTSAGLHVQAEADTGSYPIKIKVSDQELAAVPLQTESFHGEWNYTIFPVSTSEPM